MDKKVAFATLKDASSIIDSLTTERDAALARAEEAEKRVERVRESVAAWLSFYHRNGPEYTSDQGTELYEAGTVISWMEEMDELLSKEEKP